MNTYQILFLSAIGPIIGSAIGVIRRPSQIFMYCMLSFAAGIMLAISFLELIPESIAQSSSLLCALGIIIGTAVMYMLDRLVPHIHPGLCRQEQGCNLEKTAVYLMLGIFMHNLPEGMAIASGNDSGSMFLIAIAIAIHNIPEGICTSAPYFRCTGKRLRSFLLSSATAIPLVVGFLIARFIFGNVPAHIMGIIVAATAAVMIYISADELIPTSCLNGKSHWTIFSLITGVLLVIFLMHAF